MTEALAARRAALSLIGRVLGEGRVLDEAAAGLDALAPPERARALRLAAECFRRIEPADRALAPLLRRAPPVEVRNLLRLAVTELSLRPGDAHGIVHSAVSIARAGGRMRHQAGLVNAVLRKLAVAGDPLAGLPVQRMPRWLRQPLVHHWGRAVVERIEAVQAATPPLDLTPGPGGAEVPGAEVLPTGSLRLAGPVQVTALPGYAEGRWWVQDAAAALAAPLLGPVAGERVLDLCAAPGGKTMQLAAAGARVTALDASASRMERLRANLARTGLAADCVVADALDWQGGPFDAVLLDPPCSATGTIRRHPELPFIRDGSEVPQLAALQAQLIDRAVALTRPGGRLVFCTCSLLPEEGEAQLVAALARHPGLSVEPQQLPGIDPGWITPEGALRLRPDHWADRGGMDGFFMVRLRRG